MTDFESVAIRRALRSDVDALKAVERDALVTAGGLHVVPRDWPDLLTRKGIFTYIAEDETPFGMVTSGPPQESFLDDEKTGEILALFLREGYQGHGLGRKLLVHGVSVIKRRDSARAVIWVPEAADRALRVVEALGFEALGATREINRADGTVVEQCLALDCAKWF